MKTPSEKFNLDVAPLLSEVWSKRNNIKERVCEYLEEINPGYSFRWQCRSSDIWCEGKPIGHIITEHKGLGGHALKYLCIYDKEWNTVYFE